MATIRQYDSNGNLTYIKTDFGACWYEYDTKGNQIHGWTSNGYKFWQEFDDNGTLIYYRHSSGVEYWYDSEGYPIDQPKE